MAWFDIVGGLAGGLQQGLGQLQQAQQAKQVEARQQELLKLQQAQDLRAEQAAKRQADQDRLEMLKQMLAGEDPLNVSGETMGLLQQKFADLVPTTLAKNTETGAFEIKMTPEQRAALTKARKDAQITTQIQERIANLPTLSKADAIQAVKLGKMDPSLVYPKLNQKDQQSFLETLYPEKAFEAMTRMDAERLKAGSDLALARLRADGSGGIPIGTLQTIVSKPVDAAKQALEEAQKKLSELQKLKVAPTSSYLVNAQAEVAAKDAAYQAALQKRSQQVANTPLAPYFTVEAPAPAGQADLRWDPATKTFQKVGG